MRKRLTSKIIEFGLVVVIAGVAVGLYLHRPNEIQYVYYVRIPPPLETEAGDRDLAQYDYGGKVSTNCLVVSDQDRQSGEECFKQVDVVRAFIEDHFKRHRRGYVVADWTGSDALGETWYFVEPLFQEEWGVVTREQRPGPHSSFQSNMETTYYSEVFRRKIRHYDYQLRPGTWALVLRSRRVYEKLL